MDKESIDRRHVLAPVHYGGEVDQVGEWASVRQIFDANMPAIRELESVTVIPPFILAAIGPRSKLGSTYNLLRKYPPAIMLYLTPGDGQCCPNFTDTTTTLTGAVAAPDKILNTTCRKEKQTHRSPQILLH